MYASIVTQLVTYTYRSADTGSSRMPLLLALVGDPRNNFDDLPEGTVRSAVVDTAIPIKPLLDQHPKVYKTREFLPYSRGSTTCTRRLRLIEARLVELKHPQRQTQAGLAAEEQAPYLPDAEASFAPTLVRPPFPVPCDPRKPMPHVVPAIDSPLFATKFRRIRGDTSRAHLAKEVLYL